jgi:hypothetical protein
MGEKAIPALEKALQSEDLEVRVRAGQALRAIRGNANDEEAKPAEEQPRPGTSRMRGMSLTVHPDKVVVTVTELVDGKEVKKTYEGKSIEELKEKHPELRQHLGNGGFQLRFGIQDDFDMDRFFEDWNKNFEEDIRQSLDDARREVERMRRWADLLRDNQRQVRRPEAGFSRLGPLLGARAVRPSPVLDAQLGLEARGLVIEGVEQDSLAARLGLERYDVLLELNGREIRGIEDVAIAMRTPPEGGKAMAKVIRRAKPVTLEEGAAAPK